MKLPRKVYVIFPFKDDGKIAGVYVGSSANAEQRIRNHVNSHCVEQHDLHDLMRRNGFEAYYLDDINKVNENHIEYDWIDFFIHFFPELKMFNVRTEKGASWENVKHKQLFMTITQKVMVMT